jgi:[glutamine synthetase] adenylyltransferase / [glutamine synthetase]-adenylyl-L-tyrosine phosphorylase
MQKRIWETAFDSAPDPQRARRYKEQLDATAAGAMLKKATPEQARILVALLSGSQFLSDMLIARPAWCSTLLEPGYLIHPRSEAGMRRELDRLIAPLRASKDYAAALDRMREFKQREMLRIAARDLARLGATLEITGELSAVADVCLQAVYEICLERMTDRFGIPYHQDPNGRWQPTQFCVLGMGKLGGQELNYSSDIDVLFVYSEEGHLFKTPPRPREEPGRGMNNHQFYTRLAEVLIAEVSRMTSEGMLFRIDLRLRPEGNSGPLVRSLASYEIYYAQWGQTWERMMLIKARPVAGDVELGAEFLEMIHPFRYPRSISERILSEVAGVKQRIESEVVKAGEIERNVKLGHGGIREIEFIVQTLQVLHAGRSPFLQGAQTVPAMDKLVQYELMPAHEAAELKEAYSFLRDLEHRLQMENNQQTHTVPNERKVRERLAALMGFESLANFEKNWKTHTASVRRIYERLLKSDETPSTATFPEDVETAARNWRDLLAAHRFRDPEKAVRLLHAFVHGPGYGHVSARTIESAQTLISRFLALCPAPNRSRQNPERMLSDPDRILARLDSFVSVYGARATLFAAWVSNPSVFELLLLLFDRSEFLAEAAIRTPDLVDELELSGHLRRQKTGGEILKDLRHGLRDKDQPLWMRRYHEVELMRIALRDILGLADFEQNLVELSALAEACLEYGLEIIARRHKLKTPPFAIIGLGKLGGREINYGSDLDVIFVAPDDTNKLPQLQQMAAQLIELLSAKTEHGFVFEVDARLRPDGEKGLLVNTYGACEHYYRQRGMLWEIQALSRARAIAGHAATGEQFQQLAQRLSNFKAPSLPLAAFTPDWKKEIARMRRRIEKERTPAGKDALAIKTGSGGLMDAEFLAQTFCLEHGWYEPNTLDALERARNTAALPEPDAGKLIDNYRKLRRIEGILRRWSFAGETVLPDDPAPLYRVAVRCGYQDAPEFMEALKHCREQIRTVYAKRAGE